mgnify:CR=1 FL=1
MATVGDTVHFWSGGACRTAELKGEAPPPFSSSLLEVQIPGEPGIDVWCERGEDRSENSWHIPH